MIHRLRRVIMPAIAALALLCGAGSLWASWLGWASALFVALFLLGVYDRSQSDHSVLRNYPVLGHLRFLLEDLGPELRQYIVEDNIEGRPFNRDQRSLIYQRSKGVLDKKAFGTEQDVYLEGHRWLAHSIAAKAPVEDPVGALRVDVGGPDCNAPYRASVLNISAMSFGSLSGAAIRALNEGARRGDFAHNTGEGGISAHHRGPGGDLIWQIGTGYFGCRAADGGFDYGAYCEEASLDAVRMIELKISQGAKPGHGGILPAEKISPEIAEARGVAMGRDCVSPPYHQTFSTPLGLLEFVTKLREGSGGKPVGFKLAIGEPVEFLSICRAIHDSGITPDFVAVDGGEGGTGAAPIELSDHMGMPILEALVLVHDALSGIGVRDRIRVFASGKLVTSFHLATAMALGADGVNTARGFMFALGCIQSQLCHTNRCPVGVATQNRGLERGLVVEDKAERVRRFHCKSVEALAEITGAAGFDHPRELQPKHLYQRVSPWEIRPLSELYPSVEPGALLNGAAPRFVRDAWARARADCFRGA